MKLNKKQLIKLIKESTESFSQRQSRIRDEHDLETDAMEEANRIAHMQLKSSVLTLCEQVGEYSTAEHVIKTMLECQITITDIERIISILRQQDLF